MFLKFSETNRSACLICQYLHGQSAVSHQVNAHCQRYNLIQTQSRVFNRNKKQVGKT